MVGDEAASWTLTDHLLASVIDALAIGNWQRGGGKGSRPKPVPRPGTDQSGETRHGSVERDPAQVVAYLAQFRPEGGG